MASRLTRWSIGTALVIAGMMASSLPPSMVSIGDLTPYWLQYEFRGPDPLLFQHWVTRSALMDANSELAEARAQRALAPFAADPRRVLTVWYEQGTARVDETKTREAEAIWGRIVPAPDAPKTLLIAATGSGTFDRPFRTTPAGVCVARLSYGTRWYDPGPRVQAQGGACYLATLYGPPGAWWSKWLHFAGAIAIPRPSAKDVAPIRTVRWATPTWTDYIGTLDISTDERLSWWSAPALQACAAGRAEMCTGALGWTTDTTAAAYDWRWRNYSTGRTRFIEAFPGALALDLGPERFREVWRSNDPLPVSYARVTGRSFDAWAENYIQHRFGRLDKENALSVLGWLGWAFWMVLLFAWLGARIGAKAAA